MKNFRMLVNADDKTGHINREIYGHFSEHLGRCIYNGIFVGEDSPIPNIHGIRKDIVEAFKNIKLPVLRWPGGCFSDEYHWKDGIGDKSKRKKMINTNWGGVVEDNSFGTHEFFGLCELIGCKPYLAANVGSGTVRELADWMQYLTYYGDCELANERRANGREEPFKVDYLGIGNENWGCGGNMRAEYYSDLYKQYASFARNYSGKTVNIACGPCGGDAEWMETMMKNRSGDLFGAISMHYYTVPTGNWEHKGDAVDFDDTEYYGTVANANEMERIIRLHKAIMERYDPEHKVGLVVDEWGCWYDAEPGTNGAFLYQQSTMRDAVIAAMHLNMFNRHSDRITMANIAQT
ncbi:MAG: alpha-N-arabinofuranosidase, partial [Oscillospiraceae bacterium]|nr:alpha-N-arabinofuranosidase [Oscillospiraceae bacterium]